MRIERTEDTDLIDELDRACFPGDERLTAANLHDADWWVAVEDGVAVGFVGILCGSLLRYGVLASARSGGLGRKLVRAATRAYMKAGLPVDTYVMATNVPSLRCLLACGFVVTHATTDEYATYLHMAKGPKPKAGAYVA